MNPYDIPPGYVLDYIVTVDERRLMTATRPIIQVGDVVVTSTAVGTVVEVSAVNKLPRFTVLTTGDDLITVGKAKLRAVLVKP